MQSDPVSVEDTPPPSPDAMTPGRELAVRALLAGADCLQQRVSDLLGVCARQYGRGTRGRGARRQQVARVQASRRSGRAPTTGGAAPPHRRRAPQWFRDPDGRPSCAPAVPGRARRSGASSSASSIAAHSSTMAAERQSGQPLTMGDALTDLLEDINEAARQICQFARVMVVRSEAMREDTVSASSLRGDGRAKVTQKAGLPAVVSFGRDVGPPTSFGAPAGSLRVHS
jgi:hypothetical protein